MKKEQLLNFFDCPNNKGEQIVNSLIIAGETFFGTLVGLGAMGITSDWKTALISAGISAGFSFFTTLAIQRGLHKES